MKPDSQLIRALKSIPWFFDLDDTQLARLASIGKIWEFDQGDVLIDEGIGRPDLVIILTGSASIETRLPIQSFVKVGTAEALDLLGWTGMTPIYHDMIVRAVGLEEGRALLFNSSMLSDLCRKDHQIGYIVLNRVANDMARRFLEMQIFMSNVIIQKSWNRSLDM